ncbi:hypothetical protein [Staphylococcus pseudoxylosus]|uniref:hypothetical protein n=1 Tax=Staphylococcus pseudoxylosus TaxID=2282419 RepID=UPI002DB58C2D|nr:hypothetical protein [Staphylococcus pseudoxylosus]MEB7752222.1 hypothetical protein [Staphylococcus pseudoxylosus]
MSNNDDFDKLSKKLDKISDNAKEMNGTSDISIGTLFNSEFMKKYTNEEDITKFVESSELNIESQSDFNELIQTKNWDTYVSENTNFSSWNEMLQKALGEYTFNNLFEGL